MLFQQYFLLSGMLLLPQYVQCLEFDSGDEQQCFGKNSGNRTCNFDETCFSGDDCDAGSPLILTPYVETGRIQEGQKASKVQSVCEISSFSGFFTVDKTHNSNLFFWFFPNKNSSAPLVVWLNGGPGMSSLFGLFIENGPFSVGKSLRLVPREYSWTTNHSVLYLDPVGHGFSFTDETGYNTNVRQTGSQLYSIVVQFFTLFPEYVQNDFFLTGESYASKYIAALGYLIHKRNPRAQIKINLKGIAVGNTYLTDPISMMNYGDHLYHVSLLDQRGRRIFKIYERKIIESIKSKRWIKAFDLFNTLILGDRLNSTVFTNLTGFSSFYNILSREDTTKEEGELVEEFLSKPRVLRALHVGKRVEKFQLINKETKKYFIGDDMKSVKLLVEILLEHYRVMFYSGQLDIIEPPPLAESFLKTLCWSGSEAYECARRTEWYVGSELAGYSKVGDNLTFLLIRNAGHRVPTDQPAWAHDMIYRFTRNQRFD